MLLAIVDVAVVVTGFEEGKEEEEEEENGTTTVFAFPEMNPTGTWSLGSGPA